MRKFKEVVGRIDVRPYASWGNDRPFTLLPTCCFNEGEKPRAHTILDIIFKNSDEALLVKSEGDNTKIVGVISPYEYKIKIGYQEIHFYSKVLPVNDDEIVKWGMRYLKPITKGEEFNAYLDIILKEVELAEQIEKEVGAKIDFSKLDLCDP